MSKVSVLIPARNEQFLSKTVDDIFAKAAGEIEVIAVLDGAWGGMPNVERPNLTIIHHGAARGMRACINAAASIAKGDYFMKTDAHCMFAEGFDEVLKADCDQDWIAIPSRYSLDPENWTIQKNGKSRVDYHFLCCPYQFKKDEDPGMHGQVWSERARERKDNPAYDIDDEMSFQGSCWFMSARHFREFLGGMSEAGYGTFIQELQEIGLKTWLGGGRVVVNKKTWYAHLHKGKTYGRGYFMNAKECHEGSRYSTDFWMNNRWSDRKHDMRWLVEKFAPVPTWEGYPW